MENKIISREYVKKNYIHKDLIKLALEELEAMSISQDIYYEDVKRLFLELLEDK